MCRGVAPPDLIENENDGASMLRLRSDDAAAISLLAAIRTGDLPSLQGMLAEQPPLASAMIGEGAKSRTPLHVATDWPGHFPNGAAIVAALIDAGADPNVRRVGVEYPETPLHWVASSDDVEIFDTSFAMMPHDSRSLYEVLPGLSG